MAVNADLNIRALIFISLKNLMKIQFTDLICLKLITRYVLVVKTS